RERARHMLRKFSHGEDSLNLTPFLGEPSMKNTVLALALLLSAAPMAAVQAIVQTTPGVDSGSPLPESLALRQSWQSATDRAAVQQAALDYVECLYNADATRIERSVHPMLTKRGVWRDDATKPWGPQETMTYDQLVALAKKWNADKKRDT